MKEEDVIKLIQFIVADEEISGFSSVSKETAKSILKKYELLNVSA